MSPTTTRKRSPSAVTVASGAFRDRILEFRKVPAQDLLPNPKNWRTHSKRQAEALSGILAEVGIAGAAIALFDPFVGSGTAIITCETTKRRCFAIELDPRYVRAAINRWEKFTGQKATLAR